MLPYILSGNAVLINLNFLQRKTKSFIDTFWGLQNVIFQIGPKTQRGYALIGGVQNEQNLKARGSINRDCRVRSYRSQK